MGKLRSKSGSVCLLLAIGVAATVVSLAVAQTDQTFEGKVVGVTDGDTITLLVGRTQVKVRLEGIDAPESGQSFGTKSKNALAALVSGKTVTVRKTGEDKYGRTLGVVLVGGVDANAKLVAGRWAWHYTKYNNDTQLAKLEREARAARMGLWAESQPLPPWEYRARQKAPAAQGTGRYWLNTSSGVRHNERCEHFQKTKKGRLCGPTDGKACGICGG